MEDRPFQQNPSQVCKAREEAQRFHLELREKENYLSRIPVPFPQLTFELDLTHSNLRILREIREFFKASKSMAYFFGKG
eukprot:scaffold36978_cov17-Tisochrysis_lutea.AAC.1